MVALTARGQLKGEWAGSFWAPSGVNLAGSPKDEALILEASSRIRRSADHPL